VIRHASDCPDVDGLLAAIGPGLASPGVRRRDVVLVTGPRLAGSSGVVAAMRERLPRVTFVERADLAPDDAPTVVVFVVSAAGALTESDCALLDAAATHTDAVIGVVSKVDLHRNWRNVLTIDRETLTRHASRYRRMPWVPTAAAPGSGDPRVEDLAAALGQRLVDPGIARRNRLRAWESRLQVIASRHDRDSEDAPRRARIAALHAQRDTLLRQRRLSKSERTTTLRSQTQRARVVLSYFARNRCASVRLQLQQDVRRLARRSLPEFEGDARRRIEEVLAEVNERATAQLADVVAVLGLAVDPTEPAGLPHVDIGAPPLKTRRLETQLMILLGGGFGSGVALTLSRLLTGLARERTVAGVVACVAIGLAVAVWVVGTRGLLADRGVLDRWASEATTSLRLAGDQLIATRVLAAESALAATVGEADEAEGARVREQVSVIDTELREHAVAAKRAAALGSRELATLRAALDAVRAELGDQGATERSSRPTHA
jgi:hypothetical protein